MTRAFAAALVLLAGCMSHERSAQSDRAASRASEMQRQQATVARPSDFSPEQVRTLQRALSDRGFAVDLTGRFDDRTQTALMDFQRARGLPSTGNLNRPTVEALGIDPREVMPVRGENEEGEKASPQMRPTTGPRDAEGPRSSDEHAPSSEPSSSTSPSNPSW
jgi:peptidoglycan hydrolase-like protein with peptidoglycan-binding domain